jgi:hypothetical protein
MDGSGKPDASRLPNLIAPQHPQVTARTKSLAGLGCCLPDGLMQQSPGPNEGGPTLRYPVGNLVHPWRRHSHRVGFRLCDDARLVVHLDLLLMLSLTELPIGVKKFAGTL